MLMLVIAAMVSATAQSVSIFGKNSKETKVYEFSTGALSSSSAFLYIDLRQGTDGLAEKYGFVEVKGRWYVPAFVKISPDKLMSMGKYGIVFNKSQKNLFLRADIPVDSFVAFVDSRLADYVDIGQKAEPQMDSARYYSHADWAQAGSNGSGISLPKGYCGKDVVVGIVDIGFDYTHRNFYDSTETKYRVVRVWDQNNSGTPPAGYSYGNEMTTQAQILAARYSHNNQTHGAHVAGIAAGGGTNYASTKAYKGMAPESDIVLVSASGSASRLFDGITYVLDYAQSVGKPCVINLSWGSQIGPHDGTDPVDLNCDYLIDSFYTQGSFIVISAGNDGAKPLHVSKTFAPSDTVLASFAVNDTFGNTISTYVDMWGETGNTFDVRLSIVDTATGNVIDNTRLNMMNSISGNTTVGNCNVTFYIEPSAYNNGKPNFTLQISNAGDTVKTHKVMVEVIARRGTVHVWGYKNIFSSCGFAQCVAGNTSYTINAWGQAENQIMVASHNTKRTWKNAYNGSYYRYRNSTPVGDRSVFSSIGPSLDSSKIKPDIAAPGSVIVSSYNYGAGYNGAYTVITDTIPNGDHFSLFGAMQGTSMAAPAASGIIALWLEAYPQLTVNQVKYLLNNFSITDSFTGVIPANGSVYFGRGKLDAFAGLQEILRKTAKPTISPSQDTSICSGDTITLSAPAGYAKYVWNTGDTTQSLAVWQQGGYSVRCISAEGFNTPFSDTVSITVLSLMNTTVSGDTLVCSGHTATIAINGGTHQLWSTGDTTATINVNPLVTTIYTVVSSANGFCPVADTFTVLVSQCDTLHPVICSGGHFDTNGLTYTTQGIYHQCLSTVSGICMHNLVIDLTVSDTLRDTLYRTICAGGSLTVGDSVYSTAGTYRQHLHTLGGCDSLLTVVVSVSDTLRDTLYRIICAGGSLTVGDSVYSTAGTYLQNLRTQGGCDSLLTVVISVSDTLRDTLYRTICAGGSLTVGDSVYSTAGTYLQNLRTQGGCDSLLTVVVSVSDTLRDTLRATICAGGSLTVGDSVYSTAGTYRQNLRTQGGCDSLLTVVVSVSDTLRDTLYRTICAGGSLTVGDSVYSTAGTYRQNLRTQGGCDSLLTVVISVSDTLRDTLYRTICAGGSLTVGDSVYSTAGTYLQNLRTQGGCDSLLTVVVSVSDTLRDTLRATICAGGSLTVGDSVYSTAGTYRQNLRTQGGCDSLLTVVVSVSDTLRDTLYRTICAGGSLTVGDSVYSTAGTYRQHLRTLGGCDSLLTVVVSVSDTLRDTIYCTICMGGRFDTNGVTYRNPGIFTQKLREPNGCYRNLVIAITLDSIPLVSTTIFGDTTICSGQRVNIGVVGGSSYIWNTGDTVSTIVVNPTVTTTYIVTTDSVGACAKTDTVRVEVLPYVTATVYGDTTICKGQAVTIGTTGVGSYTWNTGDTTASLLVAPNATTTYVVTIDSVGKCAFTDSVVVGVLPVVLTLSSGNTEICEGASTTIYVHGGSSRLWNTGETASSITVTPPVTTTYYVVSDSVGKCSKTDSITVTVHPKPLVLITGDTVITVGETALLTASGAHSYVWSTGATTSYINVSPYITTRYSVEGTDQYGCRNSAVATIEVNPNSLANASELEFKVYPIPTSAKLTVEAENISTITVYSIVGKVMDKIDGKGTSKVEISVIDYPQGVYVISMENASGLTGRKTFIVR